MTSTKEAILNNSNFIHEINQNVNKGFYRKNPDEHDCFMEAANTIVLQAEHLENSSEAIAEFAEKLLNSLSGKR